MNVNRKEKVTFMMLDLLFSMAQKRNVFGKFMMKTLQF